VKVALHLVRARQARLAALLEQHGYLPIAELCQRFAISEATARRDLAALASERKVTRTRGGAFGPLDDFNQGFASFEARRRRAAAAKLRIARAAHARIKPGTTVFLDAGTTLFVLATLLRREPVAGLRVVTNSLPIAESLGGIDAYEVHLLGGRFLDRQSVLLGPEAGVAAGRWRFETAFLGAEGLTPAGLWNSSPDVVAFQRSVLRSAAIAYVCLDAGKLGHATEYRLADWEDRWRLLTSARPTQLSSRGISEKIRRGRVDFA